MDTIYYYFVRFYHENLHNFLAGFDCDGSPVSSNQFNHALGLGTLAVAVVIALLYYFLRHARFNGLISWLVTLFVVALITWIFGYTYVLEQSTEFPAYVTYGTENCMVEEDDDNVNVGCESLQPNVDAVPVLNGNVYVGFGFANMIIGVIWFFLISIIIKRFSPSCRHTPWVSVWPKH